MDERTQAFCTNRFFFQKRDSSGVGRGFSVTRLQKLTPKAGRDISGPASRAANSQSAEANLHGRLEVAQAAPGELRAERSTQ